MQLLISDANILIDLEEGVLLEVMFQLPYNFATPDILFVDELEENHQHLPELGLQLNELSEETMLATMVLIQRYTKASRYDCFALALAIQENCPLLTGDNALRKAAKKEQVTVRGTLWLVEQMIEQQLISIDEARKAYQLMKKSGSRLPWKMVEDQLSKIERGL